MRHPGAPILTTGARVSPFLRRSATAAVLAAGAALLAAPPAGAVPAVSAVVTAVSDPGDNLGGGGSYRYTVAGGDRVDVTGDLDLTGPVEAVRVNVTGVDGSSWSFFFAAPPGGTLVPGSYPGAVRYPFNDVGQPGLDISRNFGGCNESAGSFVVTDAVFGTSGYVQTFHATFEQHCERAEPALRGEIRIDNPPQPPPLALGVTLSDRGAVRPNTGVATVTGTVTCTVPVTTTVAGRLTQVGRKLVNGSWSVSVTCTPGAPVRWTAPVVPWDPKTRFAVGGAEGYVEAGATDPVSGQLVRATGNGPVRLARR